MKRLIILVTSGCVVIAAWAFHLYGPKASKATPVTTGWSLTFEQEGTKYDDSDFRDDEYRILYSYSVPANTTGAHFQIYWNNDITTAKTRPVGDPGDDEVMFSWPVGEFGDGNHDAAYYFTVELCDEDDNVMASDVGRQCAFITD